MSVLQDKIALLQASSDAFQARIYRDGKKFCSRCGCREVAVCLGRNLKRCERCIGDTRTKRRPGFCLDCRKRPSNTTTRCLDCQAKRLNRERLTRRFDQAFNPHSQFCNPAVFYGSFVGNEFVGVQSQRYNHPVRRVGITST
jgi:hypothetical protein